MMEYSPDTIIGNKRERNIQKTAHDDEEDFELPSKYARPTLQEISAWYSDEEDESEDGNENNSSEKSSIDTDDL